MSNDSHDRALTRQALAATAFVEIVDTLVDDFDVIEVLTRLTSRCVEVLEVAAAGILLADEHGRLRVIGASTDAVQLLELFQIQNDEGPCLDCYATGAIVCNDDLERATPWPRFAVESIRNGFSSVCAVPLRLREMILGCLNLFLSDPVGLSDAEIVLAQALADVASIAIVQDQATRQAAIREGHLQHALSSRIVIEQAKGMIAERVRVDMDEAFNRLRAYTARPQPRPHRCRRGDGRWNAVDRPGCRGSAPSPVEPRQDRTLTRSGRQIVESQVELDHVDARVAKDQELTTVGVLRHQCSPRPRSRGPACVATRGVCSRALAIEMCGSRPDPEAVTASTGTERVGGEAVLRAVGGDALRRPRRAGRGWSGRGSSPSSPTPS